MLHEGDRTFLIIKRLCESACRMASKSSVAGAPSSARSGERPPLISIVRPLLVQLRLPRENAASSDPVKQEVHRIPVSPMDDRRRSGSFKREWGSSVDEKKWSGDGVEDVDECNETSRKKARKPSYLARKEEKDTLLEELHRLETEAEALRARIGLPSLEATQQMEEEVDQNRKMEEAHRSQLLSLCSVQSMLANFLRDKFAGPLKVPVRLGRDMTQRRETIMALRKQKLDLAYRYLEHRLYGVDERQAFGENHSWTSSDGDLCFHWTDVSHFEGVLSLKQVVDALQFYMMNIEITISEVLGQLTLREDIDCVDTLISNHRIVTSTDHGLVVESNSVNFSEYHESYKPRGGEEFAVFTTESVDEDELYPYCPSERIRKNLTATIALSTFRRPRSMKKCADSGEDSELVVAMRRCMYLTFKKPLFPVSDAAMEDLSGTVASWGQVMTKSVREYLHSQASTTTLKQSGVK